ncbi:DNA helicase MCM9-like isoform X2 [Atheta coriaria]|uniref:DNA helicase MCM9-like isoform X2 n=1 Tax=Dalotia coriaria TaxID=877792 RepID=UPI0031F415EF
MFAAYLLREHKSRLCEILSSSDTTIHHSINILFVHLWEEEPSLAALLLHSPDEAIKKLNEHLQAVQDEIQVQLSELETNPGRLQLLIDNCNSFKGKIHLRVYDLHFCTELNRHEFPKCEESSYLQISGTVTRISAVKLLRYKRDYICLKCKASATITAAYETKYRIIAPRRCSNENCNSTQMKEVDENQPLYCRDYQEIKIQDLTRLGSGVVPHSMWVTLEDDLADICKPGDSVTVCGIVKRRWGPPVKGKRVEVTLALQAHHVTINNIPDFGIGPRARRTNFESFWRTRREDELRGRDVILRSFSPEIHGLYLVKLAVAVVLAGGIGGGGVSGSQTRVQPHLLLVGDPGTGKSQLLRQAAKVIPRSVCTTGIGSTSAGLTVTAIMEDGEWQLEAGALVLSDGGICCIDEFHTMREHDRTSIHEAMEQQSISVAKASIVCKLNTRCSILAAANPQGPLDGSQTLSCNIALASPLLSRFDLILTLKDTVDEVRDARVADFILRRYGPKPDTAVAKEIWSLDTLKDYYLEIRKRRPCLTPKVTPILNAYYQYRRKRKFRNEARTTVRLLDSLVRLSKAHAKLMYRDEVNIVDAVMAIALLEASVVLDSPDVGTMFDPQIEFPEDPTEWYKRVEGIIFDKLHLDITQFADSVDIHECTTRLDTVDFECSENIAENSARIENKPRLRNEQHVQDESECQSTQGIVDHFAGRNDNTFAGPPGVFVQADANEVECNTTRNANMNIFAPLDDFDDQDLEF